MVYPPIAVLIVDKIYDKSKHLKLRVTDTRQADFLSIFALAFFTPFICEVSLDIVADTCSLRPVFSSFLCAKDRLHA